MLASTESLQGWATVAVITKITCYFRLDTVLRNPHHSLSAVGIVRLIGTGGSCSTTSSSRSSSRCRPCNPMFGCLTSCPCRRRRCQCRSRSFCTYLNGAARVIGLCVTSGIWFCITACLLCESFPVDRSSRCHGSLMAIAWYRYSIESYFFFFSSSKTFQVGVASGTRIARLHNPRPCHSHCHRCCQCR